MRLGDGWIIIGAGAALLTLLAILVHWRWLRWIVGAGVTAAILIVITVGLKQGAEGDGATCPFKAESSDLSSSTPILWEPVDPKPNGKIAIGMDDYVDEARTGKGFVDLVPTKANKKGSALPATGLRAGAFVRGSLTDGTRSLGAAVTARAVRSRDGRGLEAEVCVARRKPRSDVRAGTYKGTVRVTGAGIAPADIPVEVTVKSARTELILVGVFIALLGAALGAATASMTKDSATPTPEREELQQLEDAGTIKPWHKRLDRVLQWLPFVSGVAAGVVAAVVVYTDDPTFGASRGQDIAKLVAVTFAAATGGLAVTAPPAGVARNRLPTAK